MKYVIIPLLFMFSSVANADMFFKANDCFMFGNIVQSIEEVRASGASKNLAINEVNKSNNNETVKQIVLNVIELVYNLPENVKYSQSIYKECLRKGYIVFREV